MFAHGLGSGKNNTRANKGHFLNVWNVEENSASPDSNVPKAQTNGYLAYGIKELFFKKNSTLTARSLRICLQVCGLAGLLAMGRHGESGREEAPLSS